MGDIYSPDLYGDPVFRQYLNRATSTSGAVPTAAQLENIVNRKYQEKSNEMWRNKELELRRKQLGENARQFDLNIDQRNDAMLAQSATGLLSSIGQLGTMYMMKRPDGTFGYYPYPYRMREY